MRVKKKVGEPYDEYAPPWQSSYTMSGCTIMIISFTIFRQPTCITDEN